MTLPPSRADLALVAELAGWPGRKLGRVVVGPGEARWRDVIARSAPPERARLARRLPPIPPGELLAGEGRRRLLAYYRRHAGHPPATVDAAALREQLVYLGDRSIRAVLLDVLAGLPPAVVADALDAAWFVGTGAETSGWAASAPPRRPRDPDEAHVKLVAICGARAEDVPALCAHELAHLWIEPRATGAEVCAPAARLAPLKLAARLARKWKRPMPRAPFEDATRAERRACALAARWGYPDPDGADVCARGAAALLAARILE